MLKQIIWIHTFITFTPYLDSYLIAPKCCPINETFNVNMKCSTGGNHTFNPEFWIWPVQNEQLDDDKYADELGLIIGNPCRFGRYRLEPHVDSEDEFHLLPNGSLYVPYHQPNLLLPTEYCLETFVIGDDVVVLPLVCFPSSSSRIVDHELDKSGGNNVSSLPIGSFTAAILQISVLIMFLAHKEIKTSNIRDLISISHCFCSFIVFLLLIIMDMTHANVTAECCVLVCRIIQIFYVATILWSNLFIYETLQYIKNIRPSCECLYRPACRNMKFQRYLAYILATTFATLFFTVTMDVAPVIPIVYVKWASWFKMYCLTRHETMVYVNCCGLILLSFIASSLLLWLCIKHSSQQTNTDYLQLQVISGKNNPLDSHIVSFVIKFDPKLELKQCYLFLIPTLNCIVDIACWMWEDWSWSWIIMDTCNLLHGLATIFIYVMLRNKIRHNNDPNATTGPNYENAACTMV